MKLHIRHALLPPEMKCEIISIIVSLMTNFRWNSTYMRPSIAVEESLATLGHNIKMARLKRRLPRPSWLSARVSASLPSPKSSVVTRAWRSVPSPRSCRLWDSAPPLRRSAPATRLRKHLTPLFYPSASGSRHLVYNDTFDYVIYL